MRVLCPDGYEILGTREVLEGRAKVDFFRVDGGELEWEHTGYTEIFWEGAETMTKDGSTCFLCRNGDEHTFDEFVVEDDEEDD